jgi:hypothetical protein
MKEERSWKLLAMLILRTETFKSTTKAEDYIKSGTSSTLTSGRVNQEKES